MKGLHTILYTFEYVWEPLFFFLRVCTGCKPPIWSPENTNSQVFKSMGTVLCFQWWAFHLSSHSLFFLLYLVMISSTDTGTIFYRLTEQFKNILCMEFTITNRQAFHFFGSLSFRKPSKVMSRFPIHKYIPSRKSLWDANVMRCRITMVNGTLWEWGIKSTAGEKFLEKDFRINNHIIIT